MVSRSRHTRSATSAAADDAHNPVDDDISVPEQAITWMYYRFQKHRRKVARERGDIPTILSLTGYGSSSWVRIFSRVVLAPDDMFVNGRRLARVVEDGVRGWRNFVSPPISYAKVTAEVNGQQHTVRADRNGVIDAVLPVEAEPGWQTISLYVEGGESVSVDVFIVNDQARTGVICDIDDTVVVTVLPRPLLAAWNSFVLDEHARIPTPGMAVLLNRIVNRGRHSPVFYVSTGAWNAAQTLTRFLGRNLYPFGPLLLTAWGPTEDRWFRSGVDHKYASLHRLVNDYPDLQWILMGDDGQHDPEIYADFARTYPGKVRAIVIRQLTPSEALLAGGRAAQTRDSTPGVPWVYGTDGAALTLQLEELGILSPENRTGSPLSWPASVRAVESEAVAEIQQDFPHFIQQYAEHPPED